MASAKNCHWGPEFFWTSQVFCTRFIKDFSRIAKPLHEVVQNGTHYHTKRGARVQYPPLKWGEPQQKVFDKLKEVCSLKPVLGFADYTKPFILHTYFITCV